MYRNVSLPTLMMIIVLMAVACTGSGKHLNRQVSVGHGDSNREGVFTFTLKNGQKGHVPVDGKNYAFELLRINSQNNVTIVLQNGKKFHLQKNASQSVQFKDDLEPVDFELDRVVQDAASIHVRKSPQGSTHSAGKNTDTLIQAQPGIEKIRLNVFIVQDTTVKLSLDGQTIKEIPLPKGTEVGWQAETSVDIELPDVHKARLDINGIRYQSSAEVAGLHLFVNLKDGKLTVEYR